MSRFVPMCRYDRIAKAAFIPSMRIFSTRRLCNSNSTKGIFRETRAASWSRASADRPSREPSSVLKRRRGKE